MSDAPTAAFLVIGNEILTGRTQDVNVAVLAEALGSIGVPLREVRVVRDEMHAIVGALDVLRAENDYIFTSGGLGPTHDDITTEAVAQAFGLPVVRHPDALAVLEAHYARLELEFNEARKTMADVPEGASLIANAVSAAPGFHVGNVFSFAGVPEIFRAMLDEVLPQLRGGAVVQSRSIYTGLPESLVAAELRDLQDRYPDVEMGSYPRFETGGWATTLVLRASDAERLAPATEAAKALVVSLGGTPRET